MNKKPPIFYIDRSTGKLEKEKIYHEFFLRFFYGPKIGRLFGRLLSEVNFFSRLYGFLQRTKLSKKKIIPFIKKYQIKIEESQKSVNEFTSFDDFFTRKLKADCRPFFGDLILPADGRYLFYQNIKEVEGFVVKGKKFSLTTLLSDPFLSEKYNRGSLVLARLCPTDYHRFHFPCDCEAGAPRLINGPLYSVNPIAVKQNINILAENKRVVTQLKTKRFGTILFLEIGATMVGTIHQTYTPNTWVKKGDEKGYFSFGGSSLILIFEPDVVRFDADLLANSAQHTETLCLFGQSLGTEI